MIPGPEGFPTIPELFSRRIGEAVAYAFGHIEKDRIPQWVLNLSQKLWKDLMPSGRELPNEDERELLAWGLLLGSSPRKSVTVPNAEKAWDDILSLTRPGSFSPDELAEARQELLAGVTPAELFSESVRADVLAAVLASEPRKRLAFANGLGLGAKLLQEFDAGIFSQKGGSPRRTVWLLLWLNWPAVNDSPSVAKVYQILEKMFEDARKSSLLGDFERFKKLAADIGLKLPKGSQGKL